MNRKVITFIKNFSYAISSNIISLLISTLVVAIVPRVIGVEQYGYFQLYLFYTSYVGFFHFGWIDGIYLRYGGKKYEELNKSLFFSQFWMLIFFQMLVCLFISIFAMNTLKDNNKTFIVLMMGLNCIIVIPTTMLSYVLQSTNRIKEYSISIIIGRIAYCILVIILTICEVKSYALLIYVDLIGKFIALIYSGLCCRDIVINKVKCFKFTFRETYLNINVGVKLMLANIASTLIIGIVRMGIERTWSIVIFGKVSLTISISNLMMVFINAIGLILFPMLKRVDESKLSSIYTIMRNMLIIPMLFILTLYYPLEYVLTMWLPEYSDGIQYMALLFPMCLYEGKMSLLINTYLKTLRMEKLMLLVNIVSVCMSLLTTVICVVLLKNLTLTVLSIVLLLGFRSVLAEIVLCKALRINILFNITLESIMTVVFIMTGWYIKSIMGVILYIIAYITCIYIKRRDIVSTISNIKLLVKEQEI